MSGFKRLEKMGEPWDVPYPAHPSSPRVNSWASRVVEGSPIFSWFSDWSEELPILAFGNESI